MHLTPVKFRSFRSLRFKFASISALLFLVIFSLSSFVLIGQTMSFERSSLLDQAHTFTTLATKPIGDDYNLYYNSGYKRFRDLVRPLIALNKTVPRLQIISVNGEVLFDSKAINLEAPAPNLQVNDSVLLDSVVKDKETQIKDTSGNISEIITPYSDDFGSRPFSIRYFVSYQSIYESINRAIITTVTLIFLTFIGTLVAITFLVNRSILSPLGKIVSTAKDINEGKLEEKIELNTKDELSDLAFSLNQMTEKLKNDIEGLKQVDKMKDEFIAIASHNLRTPLTVIKDYLPFFKEKNLDKDTMGAVQGIEDSTRKLEAITESLLNLVSLEKEKEPLHKSPTDVIEILTTVIDNHKIFASEKKVSVTFEKPKSPITLALDKPRIRQAFASILDNAIKFNRESGQIIISLWVKNGEVLVSFADTGVGIKPEELSKIFQKFHRGTDVLTYNYEGIGIGLYLAKIIIESHGGQISVKSELGKGTLVTVSLPLQSS